MDDLKNYKLGGKDRLSAKRVVRGVNFVCIAPEAKSVALIGDFNQWYPNANPLERHTDGSWRLTLEINHGHHQYLFLVDGVPVLDPKAQGITRNAKGERVSMLAVS